MQEPSHLSSGRVMAMDGSRKRFRNDGVAGGHCGPRGALPPAIANQSGEVSDSNSASHQSIRHVTHNNEVRILKYKGVVIQPNGNWGAQIYANQKRIWLGTFKSEADAAMAYDSAAMKLRDLEAHRNFRRTEISLQETEFQRQLSTSTVLNMIKDGSYLRQFAEYRKAQTQKRVNLSLVHENNGARTSELFHKELTPSDVGNLNRLVIPKKYAVMYFPPIPVAKNDDGTVPDVELVFLDREEMTSWTFRYCYWKSSQSFVFTRGWNKFIKSKGLKPKDKVIFSVYDNCKGLGDARRFYVIDVAYHERAPGGGMVAVNNVAEVAQRLVVDQPRHVGNGNGVDAQHDGDEVDDGGEVVDENVGNGEEKGVFLFGVRIG